MIAELDPRTTGAVSAPERTRVFMWASDPITSLGLEQALGCAGELSLVDWADEADALVVATERLTPDSLAVLRRRASISAAPAVLVTGELRSPDLLCLVECRVVAILHRNVATGERLRTAINTAGRGGGALPPDLLGELLRQVENLQKETNRPSGSDALTNREVDVVRLLADGYDTKEIGARLNYSERTVKNVIHAAVTRLNVCNRPQLAAYAVRAGLI